MIRVPGKKTDNGPMQGEQPLMIQVTHRLTLPPAAVMELINGLDTTMKTLQQALARAQGATHQTGHAHSPIGTMVHIEADHHEIADRQAFDFPSGPQDKREFRESVLNGLKNIANDRHLKLSELIGDIDARRQHGNLSSVLRRLVLEYYRRKAA